MGSLLTVFVIKFPSPCTSFPPKSREYQAGKKKKSITPCTSVCMSGAFQHWNLIKLTSKGERLEARPGHSVHVRWLAHRFIKMGQPASQDKTLFPPGSCLLQTETARTVLLHTPLHCMEELISGEWASVSVRGGYNGRCFVHSGVAVMNVKQFSFWVCSCKTGLALKMTRKGDLKHFPV